MKLSHIEYDLVGAYIKKELTGAALSDFKSKLNANDALQEEVIFQKSILSALRLDMVEEAMNKAKIENLLDNKTEHPRFEFIQNNMQQARTANAQRQRRIRRWVVTGLAAACILLVGRFGYNTYFNHTPDKMIASRQIIFVPSETESEIELTGERDKMSKEVLDQLQSAENLYKNGDYKAALNILNKISYISEHISLAKGIIYAKLGDDEKSIDLLRLATSSEEDAIKDEAHFVLGLVYLRFQDNKVKAEEQFAKIRKNEKYKIEIDRILKKY